MNRSRFAPSAMLALGLLTRAALAPGDAKAASLTETTAPYTIIYTLTNIPLSDGGVLNGTFATDNYGGGSSGLVNQGPYAFDLVTSGGNQPGETYTPATNAIAIGPYYQPTGWDFFDPYNMELQLRFGGNLITGVGVYIIGGDPGPSYECHDTFTCPTGTESDFAIRYVSGTSLLGEGATSATPIPPAMALFGGGLGLIGLIARRKRRRSDTSRLGLKT